MQVSSINKIEGKLYISSGGLMSLNTRFSLYRYQTFYNTVMRKLYNHRRAKIDLQNHMKKRRTVLRSNEHLKVWSTAETSTSTSWFKEKLDLELDKYMSEVIDSTAVLSFTSDSSSPILQECANEVPASNNLPNSDILHQNASEFETSRNDKEPTKEDLDRELDEYMSAVRMNTHK